MLRSERQRLPYTLRSLYRYLNISEQAVSQYRKRKAIWESQVIEIHKLIVTYRVDHPGCGMEKMYRQLLPLPLGRDRFIDLMHEFGYQLKRKIKASKTTLPGYYQWPNYIEGRVINQINQIWQSDITYFLAENQHYYITFIMDVYSRLIISYVVADNLTAKVNLRCLKRAVKARGKKLFARLIHHSDRGSQYTSLQYLNKLYKIQAIPSMGEIAQDNAYVERVNGIIKNEYLVYRNITSLHSLKRWTKQAVDHYNNVRIHDSLPENLCPSKFEAKYLSLEHQRRPKVIIYADGNHTIREDDVFLNSIPKKDLEAHICPIVN